MHAARFGGGSPGVFQGSMSYVLQDADGQIRNTHSVSAGLDYAGVGPEHSFLHDTGRVRYVSVTDAEALDAFRLLSEKEGIIPALESAHAVAYARTAARGMRRGQVLIVNVSGRGDKDVETVRRIGRGRRR
jgi:tryptophan synthase beta chain